MVVVEIRVGCWDARRTLSTCSRLSILLLHNT
jgi:hypothetical protein